VGDSAPVEITTNNDDVTPPTALLLQPSAGVTVKGVYNVLAAAGDDLGLAALEVYVDGVLIETTTSSSHYFPWDTTSVGNGARTLQARARDGAGNVGLSAPVTVTVNNPDVTPPVASIASPAAGSTVSGAIEVTAAASDAIGVTRVDLLVDGIVAQYRTAPPYTFTWDTTAKPNGAHTLQARARDAAGNLGYSATSSVTVDNADTTPPAVSITSPANGSVVSGTRNVAMPATDLNGVTAVELYLDGVKLVTDTASPYSFAWSTAAVPNGPHVLQARALDAAGNAGQSAPVAVTVNNPDYTAPATAILSPAVGEVVAGTITVTTSSSDNVGVTSVELLRAGVVIATATSAPWSLTWDTTTFADGVHTIRTRARDAAGNTGLSPNRSIIVDN
jgi:hypothetical protein